MVVARRMVSLAAVMAMMGGHVVTAAAAEETQARDCVCLVGSIAPAGEIERVEGPVLMAMPTGFEPAYERAPLNIGSNMVVGPKAEASIRVGSACALRITENINVSLAAKESDICVKASAALPNMRVVSTAVQDDITLGTRTSVFAQATPPPATPAAGAAGGAGAGAGAAAGTAAATGVGAAGVVAGVAIVGGIAAIAASNSSVSE